MWLGLSGEIDRIFSGLSNTGYGLSANYFNKLGKIKVLLDQNDAIQFKKLNLLKSSTRTSGEDILWRASHIRIKMLYISR